ncbi:MAG: hypothetical protein R3E77_02475 [Steroidobacteraceae bacterium]
MTRRHAIAGAVALGVASHRSFAAEIAAKNPGAQESMDELTARWRYAVRDGLPQSVRVDERDARRLYLCLKNGGLASLQIGEGDAAPRQISRLAVASFGQLHVMDAQQQGSLLYLALGDLFAARGSAAGLAIVDCAEPSQLRLIGLWISPQRVQGAAAVLVRGERAYVAAMSHGVLVFDVARADKPRFITTIKPDPDFPRPDPGRVARPNSRGLAIDGSHLYIANDAGGVRVFSLGQDREALEVGRYVNARMATRQQAYNNLVIEDGIVFAAVDYAGLEIISARDPARMSQLGWWNPWRADTASNRWFNSRGHTNQIALDGARRLVYLSAGDSELQVVDVADPATPKLIARHGAPGNGRGTWGLALARDAAYLTYLRTWVPFRGRWSGLVSVELPSKRTSGPQTRTAA